jgi:hypothetical protein
VVRIVRRLREPEGEGLVACPICGAAEVGKAPMAPAVPAKERETRGPSEMFSSDPGSVKAMLAAAAAVQKKLLEGSEGVGDRFAEEARAIHLGEAPRRAIHGRATPEQAASLHEDGVPVAPLLFPLPEPVREN